MITVSVIIPVFNTEKYLRECLDSILAQTLENIELICVNDGSLDGSLEILREYEQKYKYITVLDQVNKGQSAARNTALQLAAGKYVYFMDSDDLLTSKALKELWEISEKNQLDVLYFSGTSFFETNELAKHHRGFINNYHRKGKYNEVLDGPGMLTALYNNNDYYVSPCLQFIKRDYLIENTISYFEGIIHEDNIFSFQTLIQAKRAFCVNDIYFYRRVRQSSVMTYEETNQNLKGYFTCLTELLQFAGNMSIDDADTNFVIEKILISLSNHVQRIYQSLPDREIQLFEQQCTNYELYILHALIRETMWAKQRENNTEKKYKAKIRKIKKSHSYKIGRKITAPVRLTKGGIKCCRQHGIIYTCKLFVKKVKRKLGGK